MSNYGIKISRQGFDVNTCSDNQLLFSSSFRSSLIYQSTFVTVNSNFGSNQTLLTHNLGYIPVVYIVARNTPPPSSTDAGSRQQWDYVGWDGNTPFPTILIDSTKIYYVGGSLATDGFFGIYVLPYPLETTYSAANIDTSDDTQGTISNNYGFKVSNDSKDVKTAGLTDLASFSGTSLGGYPVRQHIIHKIGTGSTTNGATLTVAHGLGYKAMHLVFLKYSSTEYVPHFLGFDVVPGVPITLQEKWRTWIDATNLNIKNSSGGNWDVAYVIFKDPLT